MTSVAEQAPPFGETPELYDPSRFNPALYPMAEYVGQQLRLGDAGMQTAASLGGLTLSGFEAMGVPSAFTQGTRRILGALSVMSERAARTFTKPEFGIETVQIGDDLVTVHEEIVEQQERPFGSLLHFTRETDRSDPPVLIVAPMSGHYATLLRDTVDKLLPHHDVYITDWKNARNVPVSEGKFGLDEYVDYLKGYIKELGPDVNLVAVCQATIPSLAAVSHIAQTEPDLQPNSLTLMAGPLDVSAADTAVTEFAGSHSLDWFADNVIAQVPGSYEGAGRLVYPGFLQLASFMGMNAMKHVAAQQSLYRHLLNGDAASADKLMRFYDEYRSVADLDSKFYLDTVLRVFLNRDLATGRYDYRGSRIDPSAINNTPVLTIEGGSDDISAPGQTIAVHPWLTGLDNDQQYHYLQDGVGHYGVFNGSKWNTDIVPRITFFIRQSAAERSGIAYSQVPTSLVATPPPYYANR